MRDPGEGGEREGMEILSVFRGLRKRESDGGEWRLSFRRRSRKSSLSSSENPLPPRIPDSNRSETVRKEGGTLRRRKGLEINENPKDDLYSTFDSRIPLHIGSKLFLYVKRSLVN